MRAWDGIELDACPGCGVWLRRVRFPAQIVVGGFQWRRAVRGLACARCEHSRMLDGTEDALRRWGCRMALALPVLRGVTLRMARQICGLDHKALADACAAVEVPVSPALLERAEVEDTVLPERVAEVLRGVLDERLKVIDAGKHPF